MKRRNKVILMLSGAAILLGGALAALGIMLGGTAEGILTPRTQTVSEAVHTIELSTYCDDIVIRAVNRPDIDIRYFTGESKQYDIQSEGGILRIQAENERFEPTRWYDFIRFDFGKTPELVIELPHASAITYQLENDYGDIDLSGLQGNLSAELDCGDLTINGCELETLSGKADYGDIELSHVTAREITLDNNCGDIELEDVEGAITAHCDFGDIEFSYVAGDKLRFTASCGDIEGSIRGRRADYAPGGTKQLETKTDMGDIEIRFTE